MSFMWNQPGQNCRFSTGQLPFLMKPDRLGGYRGSVYDERGILVL